MVKRSCLNYILGVGLSIFVITNLILLKLPNSIFGNFGGVLYLRRIRKGSQVIKISNLRTLLGKHIPRIKVVVFDMDGTLSTHPVNPADPQIIEQIIELTKEGIHVGIVSGASDRIQKVLFNNFPADFQGQEYIHIYGFGGTKGYPLGKDNKIDFSNPYYECSFTEEQRRVVMEVVEAFKDRYSEDFEAALDRGSKVTIRLRQDRERSDEVMEEYVRFLKGELESKGMPELVVNAGGSNWGLDILVADKSRAIEDLVSRIPGVSLENIMVVADSFSGLAGNDKAMILPGVLVFNVGPHQDVPSGIYSLEKKGPEGTKELMAIFIELLKMKRQNDN